VNANFNVQEKFADEKSGAKGAKTICDNSVALLTFGDLAIETAYFRIGALILIKNENCKE
jgi:hypothetical protein